MMISTFIATLALVVATNTLATPEPKASIDPCALLTTENVFRLLGWTVTSEKRAYRHFYSAAGYAFHRRAGWSCTLESSQGVVTVTVAAQNAAFPADTPFDEPYQRGFAKEIRGYPASVLLFNGTVYIRRNHHEVSVRVVPYDHAASYNEIEGVVPIVVRRLP
jgi:hypothetical protein